MPSASMVIVAASRRPPSGTGGSARADEASSERNEHAASSRWKRRIMVSPSVNCTAAAVSPGNFGAPIPYSCGRDFSEQLAQHVAAVAGEGPHLGGPAPGLDRFAPGLAGEHLGALELVVRAITRLAFGNDGLLFTADEHGERLLH